MTPPPEWPRERLNAQGPRSLTLKECLALVLGAAPPYPVAERILDKGGLNLPERERERAFFTALETSGQAHLSGISGLGEAGRARVLAAFELARRYRSLRASETGARQTEKRPPRDLKVRAADAVPHELRLEPQEWLGFVPVYLTAAGYRLGEFCLVERGTRTHVNTEPGELFARVLALRPQGIYLFHNHPSGYLVPSLTDEDLTRRTAQLCEALGLRLFGHGVVGPREERWVVL